MDWEGRIVIRYAERTQFGLRAHAFCTWSKRVLGLVHTHFPCGAELVLIWCAGTYMYMCTCHHAHVSNFSMCYTYTQLQNTRVSQEKNMHLALGPHTFHKQSATCLSPHTHAWSTRVLHLDHTHFVHVCGVQRAFFMHFYPASLTKRGDFTQ